MNVPSYAFLGFAAVVAVLINLHAGAGWRRAILLGANLVFFVSLTRDPRQLIPFLGLLILGFLALKLMEWRKDKIVFVAALILIIATFVTLKRYVFVPPLLLLPTPYVIVGMSYVFFRVLHLVIDAYQDALTDKVNLVSYANYTLNFTALVAGPIQFYKDYRRTESQEPAPLDRKAIVRAVERVISGFFKVSVISPALLLAHQVTLHSLHESHALAQQIVDGVLLLSIFPVYIYFNFSGYVDFVIGVARFLRLELPENFNRPFFAVGVIDFWTRWHMTLSHWLKTYVYSPLLLSLMRRFPSRTVQGYCGVFAYFVTFFLVGVWHGQTAGFLVFGLLTGLGISLNKAYELLLAHRLGSKRYLSLTANKLYVSACRGLNFTWFSITMLWFWSSPEQLREIVSFLGTPAIGASCVLLWAAATVVLSALKALENVDRASATARAYPASPYLRTIWYTTLATLTISVTIALNSPVPHIIYRAF
ncbi:MAG TPA: MBOAT family O-acyltransferase [Candidatus Rubrimentiphilum sp.]|nr:MBOAT family O-acyltransferase [Candidatus Rubrimentiphilum sp.]